MQTVPNANPIITSSNASVNADRQSWAQDWENARNILCVRLDQMGDILMTTPAIRALKDSLPGRQITLLASSSGSAVASLIPEIDSVITYDAPWMKSTPPRQGSREDEQLTAWLHKEGFDGVVIFTVYSQNPLPAALMCFLAGIPLRLAHCRENPYQLLTHWVQDTHPEDGGRHEVRRQLDLVAALGCKTADERLSLHVPGPLVQQVKRSLHELGLVMERPWVVVHPGASAASRRYPPELYAQVGQALAERFGIQLVFTGVAEERELVSAIQNSMNAPSLSLVGSLSLGGLAALIREAPLLISNNTGPVHIAAAVGTPVVDLYALTNPQHTPWMVPSKVLYHDVPCKYCYKSVCPLKHHDCLRKVPPEDVVQAAWELLSQNPNFQEPLPSSQMAWAENERSVWQTR